MRPKIKAVYFLFGITFLSFSIFTNTLDNRPTNWDDPAIFSNPVFHGLSLSNLGQALTFRAASTPQGAR